MLVATITTLSAMHPCEYLYASSCFNLLLLVPLFAKFLTTLVLLVQGCAADFDSLFRLERTPKALQSQWRNVSHETHVVARHEAAGHLLDMYCSSLVGIKASMC
jgi:hypothetical protein